jgi:mRNA interferase MazF
MPQPEPSRGEVWLVDLGYRAKVRPCLVISIQAEDQDRALITFVPRTTSERGTRFEVKLEAPFFNQPGVFDTQGINTIDRTKFQRSIGKLTTDQMHAVETALKIWLGLT